MKNLNLEIKLLESKGDLDKLKRGNIVWFELTHNNINGLAIYAGIESKINFKFIKFLDTYASKESKELNGIYFCKKDELIVRDTGAIFSLEYHWSNIISEEDQKLYTEIVRMAFWI